jgi:uncharacterized protein YyaL (SSP411 family)
VGLNRLGRETSPYLRQHQDNPVDWYAWGPDAFADARATNRPILLSVGYSACHWCHVMAHECFEDDEVARVMNDLFVNVKLDREERPDVDAVYMDALQAMTGRGGWPMTMFLTPTGEPFYGGTYFPKAPFLQALAAIDDVWRNRPDDVRTNVTALLEAVRRTSSIAPASTLPPIELVAGALAQFAESFDHDWGGFGRAPKFPSTMNLDLVARHLAATGEEWAATVLTTSLDAMASGGVYDHLGGGFARYSVDDRWLVPHFEKMLYDQALLARVYLHAWQVTGHERWLQVLTETIEYVLRDLRHERGGLYSAEDADSPGPDGHGHEGLFYVWTPAEIAAVLDGDELAAALDWYEAGPEPNFEGHTILSRLHHRGDLLRPPLVEAARAKLFAARAQRARPSLDDKVLAEWNGLMLATLADAAAATGNERWLDAALATGEFLLSELRGPDGRWSRSWHADGGPRHAALAADHAALLDAFTRLGEASGQARWIAAARDVAEVLLDHFWDVDSGGLYTTADDAEALVVRQKDLMDNATPSANSTAASALARLAALTGERRYANHAEQILRLLARIMTGATAGAGNALAALQTHHEGITEVAVVGARPDLVDAVQHAWRPDVVLSWGEPYDSPLWSSRRDGFAYVCHGFVCDAPTGDVDELVCQLQRAGA